jgi:hypothetical protein
MIIYINHYNIWWLYNNFLCFVQTQRNETQPHCLSWTHHVNSPCVDAFLILVLAGEIMPIQFVMLHHPVFRIPLPQIDM